MVQNVNKLRFLLLQNLPLLLWGCAGSSDINQLQRPSNRAAKIITDNIFDTPSRPLIAELGWKTTEEVIGNESNIIVFRPVGSGGAGRAQAPK